MTQKELLNNNVWVEFDDNNQPVIHQKYQVTKINCASRFYEIRPQTVMVNKHPYGKDYKMVIVCVKINNKYVTLPVARLVWIYFNGDIPDKMDVDHIDDNTLNNSLSNLQLLTRAENIRKRGCGRNQHSAKWSDEEILIRRQEKMAEKQNKQDFKKFKLEMSREYANCRLELTELQNKIAEYSAKKSELGRLSRMNYKEYIEYKENLNS